MIHQGANRAIIQQGISATGIRNTEKQLTSFLSLTSFLLIQAAGAGKPPAATYFGESYY